MTYVQVKLEPLVSLLKIGNLKAPLNDFPIVDNLSEVS